MSKAEKDYMGTYNPEFTTYAAGGERNYGVQVGQRGHHLITGDQEIEVVSLGVLDNNSARFRYYGGNRHGVEFTATAEHFDEMEKSERCPTCGVPVYSVFDHVDDCSDSSPEQVDTTA